MTTETIVTVTKPCDQALAAAYAPSRISRSSTSSVQRVQDFLGDHIVRWKTKSAVKSMKSHRCADSDQLARDKEKTTSPKYRGGSSTLANASSAAFAWRVSGHEDETPSKMRIVNPKHSQRGAVNVQRTRPMLA